MKSWLESETEPEDDLENGSRSNEGSTEHRKTSIRPDVEASTYGLLRELSIGRVGHITTVIGTGTKFHPSAENTWKKETRDTLNESSARPPKELHPNSTHPCEFQGAGLDTLQYGDSLKLSPQR